MSVVIFLVSIMINTLVLAVVLWILSDKKNNPFKAIKTADSGRSDRKAWTGREEPWFNVIIHLPEKRGFGVAMAKIAGLVVTIEVLRLALNPILVTPDSTSLIVVWVCVFVAAWFAGVMMLFGWNAGQAIALALAMWGLRLWFDAGLDALLKTQAS